MHELSITQEIVKILSLRAMDCVPGGRVTGVVLEIGKVSGVLPDAIRFCFDHCAVGTPVEGAQLQIIEPPGIVRCRSCNHEFALKHPFGQCECGSSDLGWLSGNELKIQKMEVI